MERETKLLKTPTGKGVVIKTYLTARERNELRRTLLHDAKIDITTNQIKDLAAESLEAAEKKYIELAVVEYDGSTENILERILEAPARDYDYIIQEIQKMTDEDFTQAK